MWGGVGRGVIKCVLQGLVLLNHLMYMYPLSSKVHTVCGCGDIHVYVPVMLTYTVGYVLFWLAYSLQFIMGPHCSTCVSSHTLSLT